MANKLILAAASTIVLNPLAYNDDSYIVDYITVAFSHGFYCFPLPTALASYAADVTVVQKQ